MPKYGHFIAHPCALPLAIALSLGTGYANAADAFDPDSPWMLGDWGGTRSDLVKRGIDFDFEYVGEIGTNLGGGYNHDHTARYSDQYSLGAHFDLQKLLGWPDAEFQLSIADRNGDNISNDRVGDPRVGTLSSSQEVWGRGSNWRMTQAWYQQKFLDRRLDIKFGRFGEGEDFNSFVCDFQNLTFCGSQVGNWGGDLVQLAGAAVGPAGQVPPDAGAVCPGRRL